MEIIFAFGNTIYSNTYGLDNLSSAFYYSSYTQCNSHNDYPINELEEENKKFMSILEKMPSGFKDYTILNGYLSTAGDKSLTIKKADEFMDFLESDEYQEIIRCYIMDII